MGDRRNIVIIGAVGLVLFFIGLTVVRWFLVEPPTRSEQWGLLTGLIVGGLVCRYLAMT